MGMIKGKREGDDRGGRGVGSKGEVERMWCEGKSGRSLEEEEFYGRGKEERDPRRKEKERMIRKGSGIVKRERRGTPLTKEDKGRRRSLGRKGGFFRGSIIKAFWTRVLFDDDRGFSLRVGSVSGDGDGDDDDDEKGKGRRAKRSP